MVPDGAWVIFTYRLSSETSTVRVRAWRILRRIGALSIQQSAYVVPKTSLVTRKLTQLQDIIQEAGGETNWLDVHEFSEETTVGLVERFNQERFEEYNEFMAACDDALGFVDSQPQAYESKLKQLQKSFRKLAARDYFHCPAMEGAKASLDRVEKQMAAMLEHEQSR